MGGETHGGTEVLLDTIRVRLHVADGGVDGENHG
jgi:hypothetical protein